MFKLLALAVAVAFVAAQDPGQDQFDFPPFMQSATEQQKQQYQQLITSSGGLTEDQMDEKVKTWVNQQGGQIQTDFNQFETQLQQQDQQAEQARQAARAKMSPAAQQADDQLYAISSNKTLTLDQKGQQIQQLFQSLPDNVRQELQSLEAPPQ